MIQNILLIILIILLFFFISNEPKINEIVSKKYIKYLFLLCIVYFIYQNYNLILLIVAILILIYFNVDFKERFSNNKYLSKFNEIKESFSNFDFDIDLGTDEKSSKSNCDGKNNDSKKNNIEPFREEVTKIKDLFENIKMEIKKIA